MSKKPNPKLDPDRQVTGLAEPLEPKPMEFEDKSLPIVALHDNALIGQTTFAAGTVLAQVTPVRGVTPEQLCSAILHGKAGPEHE